jgi:hypothetical protein
MGDRGLPGLKVKIEVLLPVPHRSARRCLGAVGPHRSGDQESEQGAENRGSKLRDHVHSDIPIGFGRIASRQIPREGL